MLRSIISIAISTLVLLASTAMASGTETERNAPKITQDEELQISVFQNTEDHRYIVSFRNESQEPVELLLKDESGNNIYTEQIDGRGVYSKRFDLVNLVDGEYKVVIGNDSKSLEKDLIIK